MSRLSLPPTLTTAAVQIDDKRVPVETKNVCERFEAT